MSQGPLCPNLIKKVQKEVSQMANRNLPHVMLYGGLSVNLNHLKTRMAHILLLFWSQLIQTVVHTLQPPNQPPNQKALYIYQKANQPGKAQSMQPDGQQKLWMGTGIQIPHRDPALLLQRMMKDLGGW